MNVKFKALFAVLLFASAILLLGCTQTPTAICGDSICAAGEENTCPTDCAKPIMGSVIVNVSGAYDTTQDLWLEYYKDTSVNVNLSASIESVLGSNWSGSQAKNLSISLNQNQVVKKPVPQYGDRQIVISNVSQGEYYFTARTNDYAYFGDTEKLLVNEDKNYYVSLDLKPSQPVIRIKAADNSYNVLSGPGKITVYEVIEYYKYGENQTQENLVSELDFSSGQEINGLFFLWPTKDGVDYRTHFKAVVDKDGYNTATADYLYTYNKYNEQSVQMTPKVVKQGTMVVQIVPGAGMTKLDIAKFKGKQISFSQSSQYGTTAIIGDDLTFKITGPYGSYYPSFYDYNGTINVGPLTVEQIPLILSDNTSTTVPRGYGEHAQTTTLKGYVGEKLVLQVLDKNQSLIAPENILVKSACVTYKDQNTTNCMDINAVWKSMYVTNPYSTPIAVYGDADANKLSTIWITFNLCKTSNYNGSSTVWLCKDFPQFQEYPAGAKYQTVSMQFTS